MGWNGPGRPGGPTGVRRGPGGQGPHQHGSHHAYHRSGHRNWGYAPSFGWGWGSGLGFWGGWNSGWGWSGGWGWGGWGSRYAYSPWGWGAPLGRFGWYAPYGSLGWGWGDWNTPWYNTSGWYSAPCWRNTVWTPTYCGLGLGGVGLGWYHCGWPWLVSYGLNSWDWNTAWSAPAGPVLYTLGYVYDYNPDQNTMSYGTLLSPLLADSTDTAVVTEPRLVDLETAAIAAGNPQGAPALAPAETGTAPPPAGPAAEAAATSEQAPPLPTEDDRESALVFAERGETDFRNGDYKNAVYSWKHALVDDPENGVLVMMLAQGMFATGEYSQAAGAVQQGLQMLPRDKWGVVVENFRELYGQAPDYTTHLRALEKTIREKPEDPALRFLAGYHYFFLGYPQQALDQLDKGLKKAPRDQVAKKLRDQVDARLREQQAKEQPTPAPAATTPSTPSATPAATPPANPPPPPPGDAGS